MQSWAQVIIILAFRVVLLVPTEREAKKIKLAMVNVSPRPSTNASRQGIEFRRT